VRSGVRTELLAKFQFFYDMTSYRFVVALRSTLLFTPKHFDLASYVHFEDGGTKLLRHIGKYLSVDTLSRPKRQLLSVTVLCSVRIAMVLYNTRIVTVLYSIHIVTVLCSIRMVLILYNIRIVMVLHSIRMVLICRTSVL